LVGFVGSIFSAERKNSTQFVSTMVGAIISVIITLLFIKSYGVIIVAIATLIGYYTIWLVRMIKVNKFIVFKENILYSTLQGIILLIESILVGYQMYYLAILCLILLLIINRNTLRKVMCSCTHNISNYYNRR
jgi:O-antigen/teichoic acid export membrane protein